jgi:hypothetical protein
MISIGFTSRDLVRAVWTFVFAAIAFVATVQPTSSEAWKVALAGAVGAGLSAVKNLVFADGSKIKG